MNRGRAVGRESLVFAAFLGLTVVMTWPWVLHLRDYCSDAGDPYLNSWIMWWDFFQTFHDPLHLFNGNIFFPLKYSLAFSEHNYGIAVLFFPLYALGIRPLTVQGLATLLGFASSGYGAFRLGRTLTGSTGAAWVTGIAFAFVPYRFGQMPHVNYLFSGWIPLLVEALVLFLRERSRKRAAWLGVSFFMNGLSVIHWLILTLIPLALTGLFLAFRDGAGHDRAGLRRGALALGIAGIALLPFLLPYEKAAKLYGFTRNPDETMSYSAHLKDWLSADSRNRAWQGLGAPPASERGLFPGLLLLLLPLPLAAAFRSPAPARESPVPHARDVLLVGALWTVLGFLGSLGMNAPFHRVLYETLFFFRSIRVPARWAMVAYLGLALLAGAGALALSEAWNRRRPGAWRATLVFVLAASGLLLEDRAAPLELYRGEADPDEATLFLARTPMSGGLVELPSGAPPHGNQRAVLRAADHRKPLVTATSGFVGPVVRTIEGKEQETPIPGDLLDYLEGIPTSYILVHDSWLFPESRETHREWLARGMAAGRLRFVKRFDGRLRNDLYAVVGNEPDAQALERLPWSPAVGPLPARALYREDATLTGSIDGPAENATVTGLLEVRGWARIPGEDLHVTVTIDGDERSFVTGARVPRPDVAAVVPSLGNCRTAGYEAVYAFGPGDDGVHVLDVLFRTADGRQRHYPPRRFTWNR
ncbi:MAG TPA: hypothetical protein VFZ57_11310 [Thermoanaerobaculia bacterium]|nr:hypothetical protein [Thermoanaerobaculia bacterium]